ALAFVGDVDRFEAALVDELDGVAVERAQAGARIEQHDQHVACGNRAHRVLVHAVRERNLGLAAESAGIDEIDRRAVPVELLDDRITRDAGLVERDRAAAAEQAVEQRRLADVRPADDRNAHASAPVSEVGMNDPAILHRPISARKRGSSCQPGFTLTNSSRKTLRSSSSSMFWRAAMPTLLMRAPPLPMIMRLVESLSVKIVAEIDVCLGPSRNTSTTTAIRYGSSASSCRNSCSRTSSPT